MTQTNTSREAFDESTKAGSELKPCPFCGGTDLSLDNLGDDNSWNIECNGCDMGQHAVHSENGAIAAWNTRTALRAANALPVVERPKPKYNCARCKDTGRVSWTDYSNGQGLDIDREEDCEDCPNPTHSSAEVVGMVSEEVLNLLDIGNGFYALELSRKITNAAIDTLAKAGLLVGGGMITSEIKSNTEDIVRYLGGKEHAIQFLESQKEQRINEILIIEMMIATIEGVH